MSTYRVSVTTTYDVEAPNVMQAIAAIKRALRLKAIVGPCGEFTIDRHKTRVAYSMRQLEPTHVHVLSRGGTGG